jgi:hypothetical protein
LGTTYAPNGQVAVDNGEDGDDLTLYHEKGPRDGATTVTSTCTTLPTTTATS